MDMLYRNGEMNQRKIGGLMGVDYSAVGVMRKRLSALQRMTGICRDESRS